MANSRNSILNIGPNEGSAGGRFRIAELSKCENDLGGGDAGLAMLMALIALSVLSLMGLYGVFNATTELKISDNHESHVQATYAARAGLNHARELLKGLSFDDLLKGPDGAYNTGVYLTQARQYRFRNFIAWATARSLDISDPSSAVSGIPDDGLINTGLYGGIDGTVLIPSTGIALEVPNANGSGTITVARYFVKVTDNNGEASELARDPADNPFVDGDGVILIRSIGVARTIRESMGPAVRQNSIAVCEGRFKQRNTFDLASPLVIEGPDVSPNIGLMFNGNLFSIQGGGEHRGISTIDTNLADATTPLSALVNGLANDQYGNIQGLGGGPSLGDITVSLSGNPDQAMLLDPNYLQKFTNTVVPTFADKIHQGNQSWGNGSAPDIGHFDPTLPYNAPSQNPLVTIVRGDLQIAGDISGGGLLVVTGRLYGSGSLSFSGLVLVIGMGEIEMSGSGEGLFGGLYLCKILESGGVRSFGVPKLNIGGSTRIQYNGAAIKMALRLIPPTMVGWRKITSTMDP